MGSDNTASHFIPDKFIPLAWIAAIIPLAIVAGSTYYSTQANSHALTKFEVQRDLNEEKVSMLRVEVGILNSDLKHIDRKIEELKTLQNRVLRAVESRP